MASRCFYSFQCDHPTDASTRLSPRKLVAILLTALPSPFSLVPPSPALWRPPFWPLFLFCLFCFFRFHRLMKPWRISFSRFHLAWYSLGPSTLLQMAKFHSFLLLGNILLCICTSSLSIHWWTPQLFPHLDYCNKCWNDHRDVYIFLNYFLKFSSDKYSEVELLGHTIVLFLIFLRNIHSA